MCMFSSIFILNAKFVGCTSRAHTGLLIHVPSAVHAFIFLARRIQPFLSLVEREVDIQLFPMQAIIVNIYENNSLSTSALLTFTIRTYVSLITTVNTRREHNLRLNG